MIIIYFSLSINYKLVETSSHRVNNNTNKKFNLDDDDDDLLALRYKYILFTCWLCLFVCFSAAACQLS